MVELAYANYKNFDYFYNGEDITNDVLFYYSFFPETNIMKLDLTEFFGLFCELDAVVIDYEEGIVIAIGEDYPC